MSHSVCVSLGVTLSDSPTSTQYPMISQTQCHTAEAPLPHCQCLGVTWHHPGTHQLPHPRPTGSHRQSCCPMSRLLPVVVLRVPSHCLFLPQGFLLSGPPAGIHSLKPKSCPHCPAGTWGLPTSPHPCWACVGFPCTPFNQPGSPACLGLS